LLHNRQHEVRVAANCSETGQAAQIFSISAMEKWTARTALRDLVETVAVLVFVILIPPVVERLMIEAGLSVVGSNRIVATGLIFIAWAAFAGLLLALNREPPSGSGTQGKSCASRGRRRDQRLGRRFAHQGSALIVWLFSPYRSGTNPLTTQAVGSEIRCRTPEAAVGSAEVFKARRAAGARRQRRSKATTLGRLARHSQGDRVTLFLRARDY
jgi:hypothetical protein